MASQINPLLTGAFWITYLIFLMILSAHSYEKPIVYTITRPPNCLNNIGERVLFENVENGRRESAKGMVKRDNKGEPIVYRFNDKNSPKPLQQFIDLHERSHHQTGYVDLPHPPRNSPYHMMNESIADCIAILRIRDEMTDG